MLGATVDMFTIGVTVDIKSEQPIAISELSRLIDQALENHRLGELTVKKDDSYELVAVKGKFDSNFSCA